MAKEKYQDAAMDYAMQYLDRLLRIEEDIGLRVEHTIDQPMENKLNEYTQRSGPVQPK